MSKYFNSIITCYRDRRLHLRGFLRAIYLASKYVDRGSFEVVITDMGPDIDKMVLGYEKYFNIKQCKVDYDGPFSRSKALNHAVLHAEGEYITVMDVDMLATGSFLSGIEEYYAEKKHQDVKLSHRYCYFHDQNSIAGMLGLFNEEFIKRLTTNIYYLYHGAEFYTIDEILVRGGERWSWYNHIPADLYAYEALGNSCFTMKREKFLELGGFDEKFIGRGSQDKDFNMRAYKHLGTGTLRPEPEHTIFSFGHRRDLNDPQIAINSQIYDDNKKNNVIIIPRSSSWGRF